MKRMLLGLLLVFSVALVSGCVTVSDYEIGVAKTRFTGYVHSDTYGQGMRSVIGKSITVYSLREHQYPNADEAEVVKVLTLDQLEVALEIAYMWKIDRAAVSKLYLTVGSERRVEALVHKTYREATRDVVSQVTAAQLLSEGRQGLGAQIRTAMNERLQDRGATVTEFFVRDVDPPASVREAIERKIQAEQDALAMEFVLKKEQQEAERKRIEAEGIQDFQTIVSQGINENLLRWKGIEATEKLAESDNTTVVIIGSGTKDGLPLILNPGK